MGGALTAARNKTVTWSSPVQSTDSIIVEIANAAYPNQWHPATEVAPISWDSTRSASSSGGIAVASGSATTTIVVFFRYRAVANDDSPVAEWDNSYIWRVRKVSGGASVGYPISSANIVGRVDGVAPASGMVGERIERPIFSLSITSSDEIQNADAITLTAGRWRVCCGAYATNNAATTTWTDFWGIGISTTNNAFTGIVNGESVSYVQPTITTGSKYVAALKVERTFNVGAGGQTVYVNHVGYYTGNNPASTGRIWAVREA
jgi:hypothetical protein